MKYGKLILGFPSGEKKEFQIETPSILIGRAPGNDLVIEHPSVSRRHARLVISSGQPSLEDLGSANGTYVEGQRLVANATTIIAEKSRVKIGDVEFQFINPPMLGATPPSTTTSESTVTTPKTGQPPLQGTPPPSVQPQQFSGNQPRISQPSQQSPINQGLPPQIVYPPSGEKPTSLSLVGPVEPVIPGGVVVATLTVQNRGTVVDELYIRVSGIPIEWVKVSKDRIPLLPGAQEKTTLTFSPPRLPNSLAGAYPFTVTVFSREYRTGENASGTLRVLPYFDYTIDLQPVRSRKNFIIQLANMGNSPNVFRLQGIDEEAAMDFKFSDENLTLQAGQRANIALTVKARRGPNVGSRETRFFNVVSIPVYQNQGTEKRIAGQLMVKSPIPGWLIPLILLSFLCLVIGGGALYVTVCGSLGSNMPLCPANAKPEIATFIAKPTEVEKGGQIVLGWDVRNASEIKLTSPNETTLDPKGTRTFVIDKPMTFTIVAKNFAGEINQSVEVKVKGQPPEIGKFEVSPSAMITGQNQNVSIQWEVAGATTISIDAPLPSPPSNFPPTGKIEFPAPSSTTTYTLTASNENGKVEAKTTLSVTSANCITQYAIDMRVGPDPSHPVVQKLNSATQVIPVGRNPVGDWLRIQAAGLEGWVPRDSVSCAGGVDFLGFPTISPALIPSPIPPTITPSPTITPTIMYQIITMPIKIFPFPIIILTP